MSKSKYPYENCENVGDSVIFESDKPLRFVQIATATYGRRRGIKYKVSKVGAKCATQTVKLLLRMERVA